MRIEIVLEAPDFDTYDSVSAVRVAEEAARLVRNDLHGNEVSVVHVAFGSSASIVVPSDFDARITSPAATYSERAPFVDSSPAYGDVHDEARAAAAQAEDEEFEFTPTEHDQDSEDGEDEATAE